MDNNRSKRIEALHRMIMELANGNFAHRIELKDYHDPIENFELLLNMLAEELGGLFIHPGSFNQRDLINPFVFFTDQGFNLQKMNWRFANILGHPIANLLNKSLSTVMSDFSLNELKKQLKANKPSSSESIRVLLDFTTSENHVVSCWGYCHILSDESQSYYFFRTLPIAEQPFFKSSKNVPPTHRKNAYTHLQLQSDIQKVRRVHQFVLDNLHTPLPPLTSISRMFHLNEFKLKKGFKEIYQTTIFKFHLNKRLELAMIMIKNTPTSLKTVALSHGFKSFPHFSKAFKKKYGKNPSYFKRFRNR